MGLALYVSKSKCKMKSSQLRVDSSSFGSGVSSQLFLGRMKLRDGAGIAGPIAQSRAGNYYFFFAGLGGASPTFVVMPTPMACRDSRPCLACAPIGPFGSRSMAC